MKHFYTSLVACVLLAANLPIQAETAQNTFQVTAGTVGKCSITADALVFSTNIATPITSAEIPKATSKLNVLCSPTTLYSVALDLGQGTGASCTARKMKNIDGVSVGTLDYNLYKDSGAVFGGGACGEDSGPLTGTGVFQTINVNGKILPQNPDKGLFKDIITATMTF